MATYYPDKASPFSKAVVASMRRLYPEELADKSFDNTGLLLESPFDPIRRQMNSVLLTIDLTKAVADEAIERKDCIVVAYHPIIFKGFKSLTLADTQQQSLLRLALEGISVYSPHSAVDASPNGLGDWLADVVTGTLPGPEPETHTADPIPEGDEAAEQPMTPSTEEQEREQEGGQEQEQDASRSVSSKPSSQKLGSKQSQSSKPLRPTAGLRRTYSKPTYPTTTPTANTALTPDTIQHTRSIIHPHATVPDAGMGRLIKFSEPQALTHLIERIARGVGSPKGFPVAIPQTKQVEDIMIRSVGISAGSGNDVLRDVDADLLFTGELSHHEALRVTEQGRCVVTLFHSNTERGFLSSVMKPQLEAILKEEWAKVREEMGKSGKEAEGEQNDDGEGEGKEEDGVEDDEAWTDALRDESVLVEVSERDRDPFGIVILQSSEQVGHPLS